MKKYILLILIAICSIAASAQTTALFDWSKPASLNPAYPAPDANNRYGEYISNVNFTADGVTFTIQDDNVKEQSQRARFLYGYNTQMVEMRAYLNSDIVISAPEGMEITAIRFEGAKVDENYLEPYDDDAIFADGAYTPSAPTSEVKFYVAATINCTATYVTIAKSAGVGSLNADNEVIPVYYNLQGVRVDATTHGLVIEQRGNTSRLINR